MKNKKLFQIIIISVIAVWVFCISLMAGISRVNKQKKENSLPALSSEQATSQTQNAPSTTESVPDITIDGNQVGSSDAQSSFDNSKPSVLGNAPVSASVPSSAIPLTKTEIINAYINAVNKLKSTPNFTLVKTEILKVSVDEMSPSSVQSIVSKIIDSNTDSEPATYVFQNGIDTGTGMSPTQVIAPLGRNAALSESIVTNANASPNSDGGYTVYISLGREIQTLSTPAPNYSTSMEVINPDDLGLPSAAKIDSYSVTYDNSKIEAVIDKDGRITSMNHYITVVNSQGNGSLVVPVSLSGHGDCTDTYQITY